MSAFHPLRTSASGGTNGRRSTVDGRRSKRGGHSTGGEGVIRPTPLFWNVLLPLIALVGAVLLFARTRSLVTCGVTLLIVLAPVVWLFTWTQGETIYTRFDDPAAAGDSRQTHCGH